MTSDKRDVYEDLAKEIDSWWIHNHTDVFLRSVLTEHKWQVRLMREWGGPLFPWVAKQISEIADELDEDALAYEEDRCHYEAIDARRQRDMLRALAAADEGDTKHQQLGTSAGNLYQEGDDDE